MLSRSSEEVALELLPKAAAPTGPARHYPAAPHALPAAVSD